MIIPESQSVKTYSFLYKGLRGTFWEDEKVIATILLISETQDLLVLEQSLEELETYADSKDKKVYITNFCSPELFEIMDKRGYRLEHMEYSLSDRKWQINVRCYLPIPSQRKSLLSLTDVSSYNSTN